MNSEPKDLKFNKDMNNFLNCVELDLVRSLVTNKFINLVSNISQESNAKNVFYQLVLMNDAVKSALKV